MLCNENMACTLLKTCQHSKGYLPICFFIFIFYFEKILTFWLCNFFPFISPPPQPPLVFN